MLRLAAVHDPSDARDVNALSRVSCGLWNEAVTPETAELAILTSAKPGTHAVLEHEPELLVGQNLMTVIHKVV